jgi:hypothetical protein
MQEGAAFPIKRQEGTATLAGEDLPTALQISIYSACLPHHINWPYHSTKTNTLKIKAVISPRNKQRCFAQASRNNLQNSFFL